MININGVLTTFSSEIGKFRQEINVSLLDYQGKLDKLIADRAALEEEKVALSEREATVKSIEDVVLLEQITKDQVKEAKELLLNHSKEKDSFTNYKNDRLKQLNQRNSELDEKSAYIKKEYAALKKAQDNLDKEKTSYKARISAGIVDLADKKVR